MSSTAAGLSLSTAGLERLRIAAAGTVSIDSLTTVGVVHNNATGDLSTSLIVNADIDPAAAITDSKLATITTAGKVSNSATTATSGNITNSTARFDVPNANGLVSAGRRKQAAVIGPGGACPEGRAAAS